MVRLILATRNAHKTREFSEILGPDFRVFDLTEAEGLPEVEETGETFEANAILKAVAISRCVPGTVVSDDSGLEVDALGGAPGVRSARYAGTKSTDQDNIAKLLEALRATDVTRKGHPARFCCILAVAEKGEVVATFAGVVEGCIIAEPRGDGGFGYDPVFVPDGYAETFAELGPGVKNRISHRVRAIAKLREYLVAK